MTLNRGEAIVAAGTLRHLVTIEQKTQTQDPVTGEVTLTWSTFATTYAGIYPMSGREFIAAMQLQAEQITQIYVRYVTGIVPAMRVNWGGVIYDIKAVLDQEARNRVLALMCVQGVNAG